MAVPAPNPDRPETKDPPPDTRGAGWRSVGPGPRWGLAFMGWAFRALPWWVGYSMAIGTSWILMMHVNRPRYAIWRAMQRMGQRRPFAATWRVYGAFAALLADRWHLQAGTLRCRADFAGEPAASQAFVDAVASGEPLVLLGNHLGAMELATPALSGMGRPVKGVLVADAGASPLLDLIGDPGRGVEQAGDTITIDGTPGAGLKLLGALRRGEALAFKADRVLPSSDPNRWQEVPFFGELRPFPRGPAEIARLAKARVFAVSVFRVGRGRMAIWTEDLGVADDPEATVRRFVAATERQARQAPDQWFNFFPAWPRDEQDLAWLPDIAPPAHRSGLRGLAGAVAVLVASVLVAAALGLPTRVVGTHAAAWGGGLSLLLAVLGSLEGAAEDRWGRLNGPGLAYALAVPLATALLTWAPIGGAGAAGWLLGSALGVAATLKGRAG